MLKQILIGLSVFATTTAPVFADHDVNNDPFWNKERIGRAVGAGLGAVLGSQVGRGDGKNAAVALGTLAGYYLGGRLGADLSANDRRGISNSTKRALETGEDQYWHNNDTGVRSNVRVTPVNHRDQISRAANSEVKSDGSTPRLQHVPGLEPVDDYFYATTRVNVRGGPSKRFVVVDQLRQDEDVHVVGRVVNSDWVLISRDGRGQGFVYGPLLNSNNGSAVASNESSQYGAECREVTQEIQNRYGERESSTRLFCRNDQGQWVAN